MSWENAWRSGAVQWAAIPGNIWAKRWRPGGEASDEWPRSTVGPHPSPRKLTWKQAQSMWNKCASRHVLAFVGQVAGAPGRDDGARG
eukprot:ctg_1455.g285